MTFEEKLRAFFKQHNPGKAYLAARIAREFIHHKGLVLEHLEKAYTNGGDGYIEGNKNIETTPASDAISGSNETPWTETENKTGSQKPVAAEEMGGTHKTKAKDKKKGDHGKSKKKK